MRNIFLTLLLISSFSIFSQESSVRRTIGINFSPLGASNNHPFYRSKFGISYRQCFGSFVLQVEANKQWQGHEQGVYKSNPQFLNADTVFYTSRNFSYRNLNQFNCSLLKGWSNDISNLYLGAGITTGTFKESLRQSTLYYSHLTDSTGTYRIPLNDLSDHQKFDPTYFQIGLILTAAIEMRITEKLSTILKFSPEFNWIWNTSGASSDPLFQSLFKDHYKEMTTSGLEISINYRL